jgi:streptogramin lyase
VKTYNGPAKKADSAKAIAVDSSGNVYVTGTSSGATDDYATIKYNTNGKQLWVKRYNGPADSFDGAYAIAVDSSGNVYVTGWSYGLDGTSDMATIKY